MANSTRRLLFITALLGTVAAADAQPQETNDKVLKFCKDHLGKKVGEGECVNLAEAALKNAGAKPRTAFKESPNRGDYVWGELVYALEIEDNSLKETKVPKMSIQPGDVIQFRDARFKGRNLRGSQIYETACPHHTSIVLAVKKDKNVFTVLEQNVNGKRKVMESAYRLTDLKTGWLRIYRPVSE